MNKKYHHIAMSEHDFGFNYGAAKVSRYWSDKHTGNVCIAIETPKTKGRPLEIMVTPTGNIRVFNKGEWGVVKQDRRDKRFQTNPIDL